MSVSVPPETLRIIGHDLERRGIKTFIIRCEASLYVVEAGYQSPPAPTAITLHYTLNDIEQLQREAQERKDYLSAVKDFLSLSRIFWTVGTYVSGRGGHLLSISNNVSTEKMPSVNIEYETVDGERVIDDLKGSAIYELCVSLYKLSGTSHIENFRYTRFSALQSH